MIKSNTPPEAITRSYIATFVRIFVLAAFLVTAVQSSADAAWKNLQINNKTGYTIREVYVSSTNIWGNNIISRPLQNNYFTTTRFRTDLNTYCAFKIVFMNGTIVTWTGNKRENIARSSGITFYRAGNTIAVKTY